jgi:hypothetical protein
MYRPTLARLALRAGLLMTILFLLLVTACGASQEAKPRPLPEDPQPLRPGTYHSEEFEPSLSFRVGKGWSSTPLEASDLLHIMRGETAGLSLANIQEVYESTGTASPNIVDVPKNLVGWYRRHPYLRTSTPDPVTVGGVKGVRFDVVVEDLPEGYRGVCGTDCVDIAKFSDGRVVFQPKEARTRLIVLKDVEGKTVTVALSSPATEFEEFAPEAQKVIDTVEWRDK